MADTGIIFFSNPVSCYVHVTSIWGSQHKHSCCSTCSLPFSLSLFFSYSPPGSAHPSSPFILSMLLLQLLLFFFYLFMYLLISCNGLQHYAALGRDKVVALAKIKTNISFYFFCMMILNLLNFTCVMYLLSFFFS